MQLSREVMLASRRLRGAPAFSLFCVLTLALSIGATTAVYAAVRALIFQPPAILRIADLVNLYHSSPAISPAARSHSFSWLDYQDLRRSPRSFRYLSGWAPFRQTLAGPAGAEVLTGALVSGDYFQLLAAHAHLGRTIQPADDQATAAPVVVLDHLLWQRSFSSDPAVVGRTVHIRGHAFQVVGVMPASFRGAESSYVVRKTAWIPLTWAQLLVTNDLEDREDRWVRVKARLQPNTTIASAAHDIAAIGAGLDALYPSVSKIAANFDHVTETGRFWHVMPTADLRLHETVHRFAGVVAVIVIALVGLVMLIACSNVANLTLSRVATRRAEVSLQMTLGCSPWRVVRDQLVESAMIAAAGGLAGFCVARTLVGGVLTATIDAGRGVWIQLEPVIDAQLMGVTFAATTLSLIVFGLIPAVSIAFAERRRGLISSTNEHSASRWRGRGVLIAVQVAISAVLLLAAALCVQQVRALTHDKGGLALDQLAIITFDFTLQGDQKDRARATVAEVLDLARQQPRVDIAAVSSGLPVGFRTPAALVTSVDRPFVAGRHLGEMAQLISTTPEIFQALDLTFLSGRSFNQRDAADSMPIAIVSRSCARIIFGTDHVVGRQLLLQLPPDRNENAPRIETRTIVGVVRDAGSWRQSDRTSGTVYLPLAQHYEPVLTLLARVSHNPADGAAHLARAIARIRPELVLVEQGSGAELTAPATLPLKTVAGLCASLGFLGLVLAMSGLYGVLSHVVASRSREMGIRLAVGARPSRIIRLVLLDGVRPIVFGLTAGVGTLALLMRGTGRVLSGFPPSMDLAVLSGVVGAFLLVGVLACYFPARRAAKTDPRVLLRQL